MVAENDNVVSTVQIDDCDVDKGEYFTLAERGNRIRGTRVGGHIAKSVIVGHAPEISIPSLRQAYGSERSLLASQLAKGRSSAGNAATVQQMVRVTEQALSETEGTTVLAARKAALVLKEEVSKRAREASKRLTELAASLEGDKNVKSIDSISKMGAYVPFLNDAVSLMDVAVEAEEVLPQLAADESSYNAMEGDHHHRACYLSLNISL